MTRVIVYLQLVGFFPVKYICPHTHTHTHTLKATSLLMKAENNVKTLNYCKTKVDGFK